MHREALYWMLTMSGVASVAGLIVWALGRIRRLPRRVAAALWAIPLLRLWIPVGIGSPYSLLSLLPEGIVRTVPLSGPLTMMNSVQLADDYFPLTYKHEWLLRVFDVAATVWLVVAAALLLSAITVYAVTRSELKTAVHWRDNVYLSDAVTSPAVYGIFRPKIVLPAAYAREDVSLVLRHENAHIRRGDNLWRVIAVTTACVYWFNPLSWLFLKQFLEQLELACDEAVLARCNGTEKAAYAKALLSCAERKSLYVSAFGGARVRVRIERILSYKKLSLFAAVCIGLLAAAVGYILLTNAV